MSNPIKNAMLVNAMLSGIVDEDLPYKDNPYLMMPPDRHWKEPKKKDGKPKTKVEYYTDEKGNIRRRKIKLEDEQ